MGSKFLEWWKKHRRVVTLGAFLILFSMYLSPEIREAKYKNDCINNSKKGLLSVWKNNEAEKILKKNQVCLLKSL